jgi:uncharacterized membrane protein YhaH (DUF805 family)
MGSLLFSPSGRIGPSEFMKGVLILVIVNFVLGILPAISPALAMLSVLGLVVIWCWIALWIKRYHDAGKSGWMCVIPIIAYLIAVVILSMVVQPMFIDPEIAATLEEAEAAGDFGAIMDIAFSGGGVTKSGIFILAAIGAAVSYGIALIFNGMIKSDPHDNQFGPATIGDS